MNFFSVLRHFIYLRSYLSLCFLPNCSKNSNTCGLNISSQTKHVIAKPRNVGKCISTVEWNPAWNENSCGSHGHAVGQ